MIADVREKVKQFLRETVEAKGIRVISIDRVNGGWVAEAEVAEKNQYLASIKPEYRVFEKEYYMIRLNPDLEVASYRRVKEGEEEEERSIR